jgi:GMP synthase (glutamine-hydrolysing)
MQQQDKVIIIDFGSQVTQLIARRIREAGVYSEIHPCTSDPAVIRAMNPRALVLSGGPSSVHDEGAPPLPKEYLSWGLPILGICYGMQILAHTLDGVVTRSKDREYGRAEFEAFADCPLFAGVEGKEKLTVWMSHGDHVGQLPTGFACIGRTGSLEHAAMCDPARKIYAVQFHPEVAHTDQGERILSNFLFKIAGLKPGWTMSSFVDSSIKTMSEQVGEGKVVLGLSGGIDSTVAAVLLNRAIGKRLYCIFVDNGLLRMGERQEVIGFLEEHFDLNVKCVDARKEFLDKLKGVEDPEQKRKIIGYTFIEVFDREAKALRASASGPGHPVPDVIESCPSRAPARSSRATTTWAACRRR